MKAIQWVLIIGFMVLYTEAQGISGIKVLLTIEVGE